MVLAAAQHPSAPKCAGPETHVASRGQTTARTAAGAQHFLLDLDEALGARGSRPDRLTEGQAAGAGPAAHCGTDPRSDARCSCAADGRSAVGAPHDIQVPEQVVEVPKIHIDELSMRTPVREPQLAEQLVEVPTLLSVAFLQQRTAEQLASIPVPRGGHGQGSLPGQSTTATASQIVDIPFSGGPHGFLPRQGPAASVAENVVIPPGGGLQDFLSGQGLRRFLDLNTAMMLLGVHAEVEDLLEVRCTGYSGFTGR